MAQHEATQYVNGKSGDGGETKEGKADDDHQGRDDPRFPALILDLLPEQLECHGHKGCWYRSKSAS